MADKSLVKDISLMGIPKANLMIYEPGEIQLDNEHVVYVNRNTDYPKEHSLDLPFIDPPVEEEMDSNDEFRGKILRLAITK